MPGRGNLSKPDVPKVQDVSPGDIIRVNGWPATKGKRFEVKAIEPYDGPSATQRAGVPTVHAWEVVGGARGTLRSFPLTLVVPNRGRLPENTRAGTDPGIITRRPEAIKAAQKRRTA